MDKHLDDQLSRLISDAVADIEPTNRLAEIRERTSPPRTRKGWYAAGGAMLAAASLRRPASLISSVVHAGASVTVTRTSA